LLAIVEYDARDTVVLSLLVAPRPPWADVAEIPKRFVGLFNRPDSPAAKSMVPSRVAARRVG
jgi:hypothetical protein